jgi:uncharacterized iron-regulated protein
MVRLPIVSLFALSLAACAHAPPPAPTTPTAASAATTAGSDEAEPHAHGERGADRPIKLPHHVIDGATGTAVDGAAFDARLRAAKAIYVGEEHPNPHDHAAELEVLERAFAVDPQVGLGLEMLPRTMQPALDDYLAGKLDEAGFLTAVDWPKTWGYPFGLYRPLFQFCRDHHLRAFALNAPRALVHAVAKVGLDGLSADEKKQLPNIVPGPAAHRELVREAFGQHPHGRFADWQFERFYAAQLVWDETMAESVAAALAQPNAPHRLVVVAGEDHVRRFAIPDRAARRGIAPYLTILPVFAEDADDAQKDRVADLLWVLETD